LNNGTATYEAEAVRAEWVLPAEFLREELQVSIGLAEIVRVRGNSMEPELRAGDRVLVDRRDTRIRQGGVFAVRDGDEIIIKQVEPVRGSEPPRIRCISVNPTYGPQELVLDGSAEIIRRVVCRISRM
jgi:phage repressor protein C with HTH and peptisase S24 domain